MKKNLLLFIKIYLLFVLIFVLQKPLFMMYYHDLYPNTSFLDYLSVIYHGLKLDASVSGYLTALPGLFLIVSLWVNPKLMKRIFIGYYIFISGLISIIFVADLALYRYWGFRLDSTPLFYLKSPKDALASVSWWIVLAGLLSMILIGTFLFFLFYSFTLREKEKQIQPIQKFPVAVVLLLLTGILFIPIRGGLSVSTMNTGKVYFSNNMELNHAAVNPAFSLFESLTLEQNFNKQYRFMDASSAQKQFAGLMDKPVSKNIPGLFTTQRPNVVFIVLESFMSRDLEILGGLPNVAVRMNALCKEGVLFTNFYANSFRTDRGLVSIMSGYPGQPTTSIMKYTHKCQSLPSIPKSLKNAGYNLEYYYGGDADFTNMRSYLVSMGFDKIVSDQDFPLEDRMTKWGAPDHIVFNRLASDLTLEQKEPFMKVFQTLSSHEPFEVPFHKLKDPYLNSVAYTDSCLGNFIDRLKRTKYWKNTIVVMVPDHAMHYPANVDNRSVERHEIPLLIIGGAVKKPVSIDTYASQIDIAATLLSQLNIPHNDFMFSKNILNPNSPHFAYFTFLNGFGMLTPRNQYIFDYEFQKTFMNTGHKDENKLKAEAFLQTLYDDLEKR
jgi:phosphoglycerol transferase MdoB-like AlkP superfamily enzyme